MAPPPGWTPTHDSLLRSLLHVSLPGGLNDDPSYVHLTWAEIGGMLNTLAPARGLGNRVYDWRIIAARYLELKMLFEKPLPAWPRGGSSGDDVGEASGDEEKGKRVSEDSEAGKIGERKAKGNGTSAVGEQQEEKIVKKVEVGRKKSVFDIMEEI
jgi:hypothetical protein